MFKWLFNFFKERQLRVTKIVYFRNMVDIFTQMYVISKYIYYIIQIRNVKPKIHFIVYFLRQNVCDLNIQ